VARTYQIPRPFGHLSALDNVALAATFGTVPCALAEGPAGGTADFTGLGRGPWPCPAS
jgi:branched-chain amino acid transport system permease protein